MGGQPGRFSCSARTCGPAGRNRRPRAGGRGAPACRWSRTARAGGSSRPGTSCSSPGPGRPRSGAPTWSSSPARRWTSASATACSAAATAIRGRRYIHLADSPEQVATHMGLLASAAATQRRLHRSPAAGARPGVRVYTDWLNSLLERRPRQSRPTPNSLTAAGDQIHPARIYGELARLAEDAVVIGDGGDFVSSPAIRRARPGGWLDPDRTDASAPGSATPSPRASPGPPAKSCCYWATGPRVLADGRRHPGAPPAAGGDGGGQQRIWGLEKHPMQALYGYDVAADLNPGIATTRWSGPRRRGGTRHRPRRSARRWTGPSTRGSRTSST